MKFILIALYLAHGAESTTMQTEVFSDLTECKRVQAMWMQKAVTGKKLGVFVLNLMRGQHEQTAT